MSKHDVYLGQTVHYVSYGTPGGEYSQECRAAFITVSESESVSICVLNPTGMFFAQDIEYYVPKQGVKGYRGGTWHFMSDCDK